MNQNFEKLLASLASRRVTNYLLAGCCAFGSATYPLTAQEKESEETSKQVETATVEEQTLTPAIFNDLLRKNKLDELAERIDAVLEEDPNNIQAIQYNSSLGMRLARTKPEEAAERLHAQWDKLAAMDSLSPPLVSSFMLTTRYWTLADKSLSPDEALEIYDKSIAKLDSTTNANPSMLGSLYQSKAGLLVQNDRAEDAKQLMDELVRKQREELTEDSSQSVATFVNLVSSYNSLLGNEFESDASNLMTEAKELAVGLLEKEEATSQDFAVYFNLVYPDIARSVYSDPEAADKLISSVSSKLEAFSEKLEEDEQKRLESYQSRLGSLESRIASSLERLKLIGTPAPEIDAEYFVATDEVTMGDLKGKVVLLDFWAVWCGPCIATFPHLIEWHEEYADQGLVILGATKFYNYQWDEEAGRAMRAKEDVEPEAELEMLERFREHHGLHHGFFVTPEGSEYSKKFQVSGIPQAVLIDKEGKIAMIKIGSGEANATALHAKIEELLK